MVRAPIAKVEDLRGKAVAVAAPGSLPNVVLNAILDQYKVLDGIRQDGDLVLCRVSNGSGHSAPLHPIRSADQDAAKHEP